MPATQQSVDSSPTAAATAKKPAANGGAAHNPPEKKYKCQFCARAFSRSEHRSRHERSHTKERPFKCDKCRSTFVRRDLLLRHDRTVHAKDGGPPLVSESRKKTGPKTASANKRDDTVGTSNGNHSQTQQELDQQQLNEQSGLSAADLKLLADLDPAHLAGVGGSDDNYADMVAASLITNLHNKSHAAAAQLVNPPTINPLQTTSNPLPELHRATNGGQSAKQSYSPEVHFDHGNYMSGAGGSLPMPWDNFLSPSLSFNNTLPAPNLTPATTSNPLSLPPLPTNIQTPYMERTASQQEPLTAHLHSQLGISMDSPSRVLSPFPFLLGPVSPVDYRRSPGPTQALVHARTPKILYESQREQILQNINHFNAQSQAGSVNLPSRAQINDYLSTYFNNFHHHLPFLHPESFVPTEKSPALLLAVMSIGALYSFHQEQAFLLHVASKMLINQFLANKESYSSRQCPLWVMQTTLINMVFSSWSGDEKGLEWACSIKSLLANMVAGNMYELKLRQEARNNTPPTLTEWIEDEGCRRTYYAVYLFYGMLTLTYNHTPAFSYNEIEDLELPSSESMWNLPQQDEDTWRETLDALEITTVQSAHDNLFKGVPVRYSAFATRIMINAIFLELWHHKRSSEALQNVSTENKLRLALETWEKSLDDCLLETIRIELSAPNHGHPLIFNAIAVYRNCLARFSVDLKTVQEALRYHDSYEVAAAMTNARDKVPRSPEMIKVIEVCFDCLQVVVMEGIKYVGRTAATNWSIEHPLCGLDLMVILSLWLYRLEHDEESATEEELEMYNRVKNLLDIELSEAQLREAVTGSAILGQVGPGKLSATVANLWGDMVKEVVVWGITQVMGVSFGLYSQALSGYDGTDGLPSPTSPVSMSMSLSRTETGLDNASYDTSPLRRKPSTSTGVDKTEEDDANSLVESRPMSQGLIAQ